jgi:hypothetical protein
VRRRRDHPRRRHRLAPAERPVSAAEATMRVLSPPLEEHPLPHSVLPERDEQPVRALRLAAHKQLSTTEREHRVDIAPSRVRLVLLAREKRLEDRLLLAPRYRCCQQQRRRRRRRRQQQYQLGQLRPQSEQQHNRLAGAARSARATRHPNPSLRVLLQMPSPLLHSLLSSRVAALLHGAQPCGVCVPCLADSECQLNWCSHERAVRNAAVVPLAAALVPPLHGRRPLPSSQCTRLSDGSLYPELL